MKIIILSRTPWRKDNSFGVTFSDFFDNDEYFEIYNIYCGLGLPNVDFPRSFFNINEKALIKNMKDRTIETGNIVRPVTNEKGNSKQNENWYSNIKKYKFQIFYWIQELIWLIGRWKSHELSDFIDECDADIIFQPIYSSFYLNRIFRYIKSKANIPSVCFMADDIYTFKQVSFSPLFWIDRFFKRFKVKETIDNSKILFVISEIQKTESERIFKKECKILTKGASFNNMVLGKSKYNNPLQLVFTGNLSSNRWETLGLIVNSLKIINKDEKLIELKIYSATPLTKKMLKVISDNENSFFMGQVSGDKIKDIQSDADILVHVEGFSLKSRCEVHQSFSTKIVDYFKMARPIFAVGPENVASMDYLIKNDAAITAVNKNEIYEKLCAIVNCTELLTQYAVKGYECGKKNHQKEIIQSNLYNDLVDICSGEKI